MSGTTTYCDFKRLCAKESWIFWPKGTGKWAGPSYGEPPKNQPIQRCPQCNRRLTLKAIFCIGGEFTCWELPDHKPRVMRKPGPRRKVKSGGRGK